MSLRAFNINTTSLQCCGIENSPCQDLLFISSCCPRIRSLKNSLSYEMYILTQQIGSLIFNGILYTQAIFWDFNVPYLVRKTQLNDAPYYLF